MTFIPTEGKKALESNPMPKGPFEVTTTSRWPNPRDIPASPDDGSEPPYSYVELIGMAVIRSANGRLTRKEICKWMFDSFQYFRDTTFAGCFNSSSKRRYNRLDFDWLNIVEDTLGRYDSLVTQNSVLNYFNELTFSIRPELRATALQASQPILCDTTFPFLKLPPEIRNQIYRLVLVYPSMMVSPQVAMPNLSGKRTGRRQFDIRCESRSQEGYIPPQVALSLFSVSRQIYQESMPLFYHENHFYVWSGSDLQSFLIRIVLKRRSWIREMTIILQSSGPGSVFKPLSECKRLTVLHLRLSLFYFNEHNGFTIGEHQGLKKLSRTRGLTTLTCEDDREGQNGFAERIAQFLRASMLLPRPREQATDSSLQLDARSTT
ncbi:MAG: hypothetical protein M1835_000668 [Candelina submexicana]|nr:MAG: hypothetical protein M1835_000668 [Candelina submexicana]